MGCQFAATLSPGGCRSAGPTTRASPPTTIGPLVPPPGPNATHRFACHNPATVKEAEAAASPCDPGFRPAAAAPSPPRRGARHAGMAAPLAPIPPRTGASTAPADGPLLSVNNLKVYFRLGGGLSLRSSTGVVKAVDDVSFEIRRGERWVSSANPDAARQPQAGRSSRLLDPTAGSIEFDGVELGYAPGGKSRLLEGEKLRRLRQRFQMIFRTHMRA